MIEWSPSLAVGIEEIDEQHRELFRRADRFLSSLSTPSRQEIGILLSYLRLYAVAHFGAEEDWMREVGYSGYKHHKTEHDRFAKDLLAMSNEHERKGTVGLPPERMSLWLKSWLEDHVSRTDADLAKFVLTRGDNRRPVAIASR
ncbi:MAG TPA: bacteriohemerythrin [Anaeromyxobacteraceae bacterium]|nr:bacteriohemerythrin [Anaeromyxobacteraceae bacterium]